LLRSEFTNESTLRRFDEPARRIVVTFGGADAHNQAARVARLIGSLTPPIDVTVVAGSTDMARQLRNADLVVCAAGSTCWEVAHLGIPALTLIVASNQERIAEGLHAAGVVRSLGWFDRVSDDTLAGAIESLRRDPARADMSRRGRALVDGHGADRVAQAMCQSVAVN
jgi:spore coat polysaccharide biosynthesis predicted glycosyltransferase SpsG